jgi:hypothetical protein
MKLSLIASVSFAMIAGIGIADAQRRGGAEQADPNAPATKYSYYDAFAPFFYSKNGSEYRAATGEPGPKYWQNRADYQLAAKLNDEANEITATEVVTYTNNSPLKMGFVWMQLDQNLFKQDSRGSLIVPTREAAMVAADRYLMQDTRSNQLNSKRSKQYQQPM